MKGPGTVRATVCSLHILVMGRGLIGGWDATLRPLGCRVQMVQGRGQAASSRPQRGVLGTWCQYDAFARERVSQEVAVKEVARSKRY